MSVLASSSMKACKIYAADSYSIATPIDGGYNVCQAPEATQLKNNRGFMHSKGACTAKITNNTEEHLMTVS